MGKLTTVWVSDDGKAFKTETEMVQHEDNLLKEKLATAYLTFLDTQVSGHDYELHPENLGTLSTEQIRVASSTFKITPMSGYFKMREPEFFKRECPALLETARNVFGDLVVGAYVVVPNYSGLLGTQSTQEALEGAMGAFAKVDGDLSSASDKFLLVFSNEHSVLFTNSEWLILEKVSLNEFPTT